MKFKFVFILAALVIVSCGKLGDKASNVLSDLGSDGAGNVIAYNNAMVDYMNDSGDKIERASGDFEKMSRMVTEKKKPNMFMAHAFIGSVPDINRERDGISLLEPGNNLPSEIREELVSSVKATSDAFANTHSAYEKFKDYYDNEEYIDDNWAQGQEYVNTIEKNITAYYDNRSKAYETLQPISDAAEIEMLKDHPLRESIIATKTDLGLAQDIRNIVYAEQVDMDALNAKYDELEANKTKHINLTPDLLKENNKDRFYKNFYESIEEFLGEVRKSKRDGKIENSEADYIAREYETIISRYNSFV